MNGITVNDTEFQGKSIALAPRPGNHQEVRITVRGEGTINDISKDDARALRDWLTAWLDEGESVTPSYDENVTRLVTVCKTVDRLMGMPVSLRDSLTEALAPFLPPPDPDADLVEKIWKTYQATPGPAYPNGFRAIIAVVRAHDKESQT